MNSPYYLNDFPRPFVSADGKPDFVVVFGMDSRHFLAPHGWHLTINTRSEMKWADITDACGFAEMAFLLGQHISPKYSPQKRVYVANWLSDDISQLTIEQRSENPNLIIIGSAKVNARAKGYQEKCEDQLVLEMTHKRNGEPKAIKFEGEKIYDAGPYHDVGLAQIVENPESGQAILFLQGFYGKGTYGACVALARKLDWIKEHYEKVRACVVEMYQSEETDRMIDEVQIRDVFIDQEIDDPDVLEEMKHLKKLLKQHKKNLRILEERAAAYGPDVPLHLLNEIEEEKRRIAELESKLSSFGERGTRRIRLDKDE